MGTLNQRGTGVPFTPTPLVCACVRTTHQHPKYGRGRQVTAPLSRCKALSMMRSREKTCALIAELAASTPFVVLGVSVAPRPAQATGNLERHDAATRVPILAAETPQLRPSVLDAIWFWFARARRRVNQVEASASRKRKRPDSCPVDDTGAQKPTWPSTWSWLTAAQGSHRKQSLQAQSAHPTEPAARSAHVGVVLPKGPGTYRDPRGGKYGGMGPFAG